MGRALAEQMATTNATATRGTAVRNVSCRDWLKAIVTSPCTGSGSARMA